MAISRVAIILSVAFAYMLVHVQAQYDPNMNITYVQPERFIRCNFTDNPCKINLTVTEMQTLNAYGVIDGTDVRDTSTSYPVTVNEQGGFDFVYNNTQTFEQILKDNNETILRLFQPIVAEGTTRRNLLAINDQLPGPTIIGYKNQRVHIEVINDLGKEAITLHWHGQHVNGTRGQQYMDGVPFVTQCPIQPGNSFVYDFNFYPAGTYWYHSHQYDERSNGMYGALIVLDPDSPSDPDIIDFPEEHTIAFFEWFPVNSDDWIEAPYSLPDLRYLDGDGFSSCFLSSNQTYSSINTVDGSSAGGGGPPFYAGLMNSVGWRYTQSADDCRRVADTILPFFNVTHGSRYRFRLIGSQVNFAYRFSIHNHRLRVVATDGIDATIPREFVDYIILHVGERYDFVLDANKTVDNYLMIAETLEDPRVLQRDGYCLKSHRVYGVLHYDRANDTLPDDFDDSYDPVYRCTADLCFALNCPFENYPSYFNTTCISVVNMTLSNPEPVPNNNVSKSAFLNFGFQNGSSINGVNLLNPPSPLLSQEDDISKNQFCYAPQTIGSADPIVLECIHTYNVETDTVEMVFTNVDIDGTTGHPIHLHGHHYFVLNVGYPTYNKNGTINTVHPDINCTQLDNTTSIACNWANGTAPVSACMEANTCPLKDTVIVPTGGYVRIRFPRNNWGWWIMHCHIEPHLIEGMAMVVNETSAPGYAPVPQGFPTCGNFPPREQNNLVLVTNLTTTSMTTSPRSTASVTTPTTQSPTTTDPTDLCRAITITLGAISGVLLIAIITENLILFLYCVFKCRHSEQFTKDQLELKEVHANVHVKDS